MFEQNPPSPNDFHEGLRTAGSLVTVVLSVINLIYAIKIFRYKDKKDDVQKEKDVRAAAFKSLVLDQRLDLFYDFFANIESQLLELRGEKVSIERKQKVNQYLLDQLAEIRRSFVDLLRTVSHNLYDKTLGCLDRMSDRFTVDIFNEEVHLSDPTVFEERILNPLSATRTGILEHLIAYDGSEDSPPDVGLSILPR